MMGRSMGREALRCPLKAPSLNSDLNTIMYFIELESQGGERYLSDIREFRLPSASHVATRWSRDLS
jgi:hypothetical protein